MGDVRAYDAHVQLQGERHIGRKRSASRDQGWVLEARKRGADDWFAGRLHCCSTEGRVGGCHQRMIPKSGYRFSEKIMRHSISQSEMPIRRKGISFSRR